MIAAAGEWMTCWTMGLNQSTHGTANTTAICNLHLATGASAGFDGGPLSLTGQPNAMGGREMGYLEPGLPGQRSITSAEDRLRRAHLQVPAGTIRAEAARAPSRCSGRMNAGDIRACWNHQRQSRCDGAQPGHRDRRADGYRPGGDPDVYADTATNRYADIVLPAALWAESEGVMVNSERTLTLMRRAVPPAGQAGRTGADLPGR